MKSVFSEPRYWYHISDSLTSKSIILYPRKDGANRSNDEPKISRICVAPTLNQSILALVWDKRCIFNCYRTVDKVIPKKANNVFDSWATNEGWLIHPQKFEFIGSLYFKKLYNHWKKQYSQIPLESASECFDINLVKTAKEFLMKTKFEDFLSPKISKYFRSHD